MNVYPMPISGLIAPNIVLDVSSPDFDPTQGVQRWHSTTDKGPHNYLRLDTVTGKLVTFGCAHPERANIPPYYKPYVIAPTDAQLRIPRPSAPGLAPNPDLLMNVPAVTLSMLGDAQALAVEISAAIGVTVSAEDGAPIGSTFVANGETRRQWVLQGVGLNTGQNAGVLMQAKNANGIGVPYTWHLVGGAIVCNVETVPVIGPDTPADIPLPLRNLNPDESIVTGGLPGIWEVVSNLAAVDPNSPATAGQVQDIMVYLTTHLGA